MTHHIIFPSLPNARSKIAPFWEEQAKAAEIAGFKIDLVSDQNERGPTTIWSESEGEGDKSCLYRGWIVKPDYYAAMSQIKGHSFLNTCDDYMWSYNFPEWYQALTDQETPASLFFTKEDIRTLGLDKIAAQVKDWAGNKSLLLKDWLKSRKDKWFDACFIQDASDTAEILRIANNFFFLQGREFYGGYVFRRFLSLKKLGTHTKVDMPLPVEYRTFFLHQKPIMTMNYWQEEVQYTEEMQPPPDAWLAEIGKQMKSPFVALDIAQDESGKWWVIEVNDGGTAGYPNTVNSEEFYRRLYQGLQV